MKHLVRFLLLTLTLVGLFLPTARAEQERLAVLPLGGDLPEQTLGVLADEIRAGVLEVTKGRDYIIMDRENINSLLEDQGLDPSACAAEANCEVAYGRNIGAALVVSGSVTEVDGTLMLTMTVHETKSGKVLASERVSAKRAAELVEITRGGARKATRDAMALRGGVAKRGGRGEIQSVMEGLSQGEPVDNVDMDEAGFLVITSTPVPADVIVATKNRGQAPVTVEMPAGVEFVVIGSAGELYHPVREVVTLRDGETKKIHLPLKPAFGTLTISSQPPGGTVFVNGEEIGRGPQTLEQQRSGSYDVRVELDDHHTFESVELVEDEKDTQVVANLDSSIGGLEVSSTPSGAEVFIDGKAVGLTPYTDPRLEPGTYKLRLTKHLYLTDESLVTVREGETTRHKARLEPNFGDLHVTSSPPGATISINGEPTGQTTPYTFEKKQAGVYIVKLTLDGYGALQDGFAYQDRHEVRPTETTRVEPDLSSKARLGNLVVTAQTPQGEPCIDGVVFVSGERKGATPLRVKVLAIPHEVYVTCLGMEAKERVEVEHNERTELNLFLQTFSRQDLQDARAAHGFARGVDAVALATGLITGGIAATSVGKSGDFFDAALAVDSSANSTEYAENWSQGQAYQQRAVTMGITAGTSLLVTVLHNRLATKKRKATLDYREDMLHGVQIPENEVEELEVIEKQASSKKRTRGGRGKAAATKVNLTPEQQFDDSISAADSQLVRARALAKDSSQPSNQELAKSLLPQIQTNLLEAQNLLLGAQEGWLLEYADSRALASLGRLQAQREGLAKIVSDGPNDKQYLVWAVEAAEKSRALRSQYGRLLVSYIGMDRQGFIERMKAAWDRVDQVQIGINETYATLNTVRNNAGKNLHLWQSVSAGHGHTCGVKSDGSVKCWGSNNVGELRAPSGSFESVSASNQLTCGIKKGGSVACWGVMAAYFPPNRAASGRFSQIDLDGDVACGVRDSGSIKCWGALSVGPPKAAVPKEVTFKSLSLGGKHGCGITSHRSVVCWGLNGDPATEPPKGEFQSISAGHSHTCGVTSSGSVECWGENDDDKATPPAGTFQSVSAGNVHTCGVTSGGSMECWGNDYYSQVSDTPSSSFESVSAGEYHTCGITSSGSVACWGDDDQGKVSGAPIASTTITF